MIFGDLFFFNIFNSSQMNSHENEYYVKGLKQ